MARPREPSNGDRPRCHDRPLSLLVVNQWPSSTHLSQPQPLPGPTEATLTEGEAADPAVTEPQASEPAELPSMDQLNGLSADLDDIDAVLARMDTTSV